MRRKLRRTTFAVEHADTPGMTLVVTTDQPHPSNWTRSASHLARPSRCCMPSGVLSAAHSAMVQQFLRGRSDSSPSTNCRARNRGSTRVNRPAIRLIRPSNASCQRAGSTL